VQTASTAFGHTPALSIDVSPFGVEARVRMSKWLLKY
jgi:hypothetical protein